MIGGWRSISPGPPPLQRPGIVWQRGKKYSPKDTEAHRGSLWKMPQVTGNGARENEHFVSNYHANRGLPVPSGEGFPPYLLWLACQDLGLGGANLSTPTAADRHNSIFTRQ